MLNRLEKLVKHYFVLLINDTYTFFNGKTAVKMYNLS